MSACCLPFGLIPRTRCKIAALLVYKLCELRKAKVWVRPGYHRRFKSLKASGAFVDGFAAKNYKGMVRRPLLKRRI